MTQENNPQQPVSVIGHFIKDLSFENPDPIAILSATENPPQMAMDVSVQVNNLNEDHFEVVLNMKLSALQNDKACFIIELAHSSLVQIDTKVVDKEAMGPVLLIHVPHLAFPFVRAIIYNLMREGGLPPFNIAPIDFASLYEQTLNDQKKESTEH